MKETITCFTISLLGSCVPKHSILFSIVYFLVRIDNSIRKIAPLLINMLLIMSIMTGVVPCNYVGY